jgi:hypothetical protein
MNDMNQDDVLSGVKLPQEKIEILKGDADLYGLFEHALTAKRDANKQAKEFRERLERIESEQRTREEESAKRKGEYERLYSEAKDDLLKKDQKLKDILIQKEVGMLAVQMGLKKAQYLKLLDTGDLEIDMDSLSVKNIDLVLKKFKDENPDFFQDNKKIDVDNSRPASKQEFMNDHEQLKELEKQARTSGSDRDRARYIAFKRELLNKK